MRILVDGIEICRHKQRVVLRVACVIFALGGESGFSRAQVPVPGFDARLLDSLQHMGPESIVGMGQPYPRIAPKSTPQPAELDEFRRRLELQCRTWLEWLNASVELSGDQRRRMSERIAELVDVETKIHGNSFRQSELSGIPGDFPFLFHLAGRPLQPRSLLQFPTLWDNLALGVLPAQQLVQSTFASHERNSFMHSAFLEVVLLRMDTAVQLSTAQESQLRVDLRVIESKLHSPFFSVTTAKEFPAQALHTLVTDQSRQHLTRVQLQILGLREAAAPSPGFDVRPGTVHVWREELEQASRLLRDLVYQRYLWRIEEVEFERNVGLESGQRLRTAAKGVAVAISDEWRRPAGDHVELLIEQALGRGLPLTNVRYSMTPPRLTSEGLETYPLWKNSLTEVLQNSPLKQYSGRPAALELSARAGAVLAMLEQELWLTPQQRQLLLPDVTRLLGTYQTVTPEDENLALLGDMALPLHLLGPDVPRLILFPAQRETFTALAAYFDFRLTANGARANIAGSNGTIEWRWVNAGSLWPAVQAAIRPDSTTRPASLPQQLFPALNSGSLPNRINIGKFH